MSSERPPTINYLFEVEGVYTKPYNGTDVYPHQPKETPLPTLLIVPLLLLRGAQEPPLHGAVEHPPHPQNPLMVAEECLNVHLHDVDGIEGVVLVRRRVPMQYVCTHLLSQQPVQCDGVLHQSSELGLESGDAQRWGSIPEGLLEKSHEGSGLLVLVHASLADLPTLLQVDELVEEGEHLLHLCYSLGV
ncbi:hypothetical protein B484DRAFT_27523 [Ochromonadaceae sp. CCMP2298]|nr:hypothetical protein B484DRAFT_27523 [Ochromonadaceae sp. CCMP2298]